MSEQPKKETFPCNQCPAGDMHLEFVTYYTWLNTELITVPNFPAWICDICGHREYDRRAVSWLSMMLDPNAGRPTPEQRSRRLPPKKQNRQRPTTER
jgi:YgiT-type zinc finger domain-containing protein